MNKSHLSCNNTGNISVNDDLTLSFSCISDFYSSFIFQLLDSLCWHFEQSNTEYSSSELAEEHESELQVLNYDYQEPQDFHLDFFFDNIQAYSIL